MAENLARSIDRMESARVKLQEEVRDLQHATLRSSVMTELELAQFEDVRGELIALVDTCTTIMGVQRQLREAAGRAAYEQDLAKTPTYHDGGRRPAWEQLREFERRTWVKNPTARGGE